MSSSVTAETLLQGAWYSLEQAGRLLVTSVMVFEKGDVSTATGIAMFGREELGRYKILRRLADEANTGSVFVDYVQAEVDDHEDKQRAATLSSTIRTERGTGLDDLLRTRMREPPASDAWRIADEKLKIVTDAKTKRTPADRHRLRMKCLYVDIESNGLGWRRPHDLSAKEALEAITDALNDYSVQRDRLINVPGDPPMMKAFDTIRPVPDLLPPRWPMQHGLTGDVSRSPQQSLVWYPNKNQWRVIWPMAIGWTLLTLVLGSGLSAAFLLALLIDGVLLVWNLQKN
jgi:AbiV family abortive infection protein